MFKYILKRIGYSILILVAVSIIIYFMLRLMPVKYHEIAGSNLQGDANQAAIVAKSLGLDDNSFWGIISGYFKWIKSLFEINPDTGFFTLGKMFDGQKPVASALVSGIPTSFFVAFVATIFEFMIAIPLGITAATHQYSVRDYVITVLVMIGISLPSFFFASLFKAVFGVEGIIDGFLASVFGEGSFLEKFLVFPVSGGTNALGTDTGFAYLINNMKYMVLPILTVTVLSIGGRMRMTRTEMLEVMGSDYIRTARAKGLKESKVIYKHAFRNTLIPLVTTLAGLLPALFSGAIITEQVFGLNGIGGIALTATNRADIPFIMGYNMFLAALSVIGILLADIMYAIVDPRVKLS